MALGVLGDIVFGLLDLFDSVGGERPHSWRFLLGAWLVFTSIAVAIWRRHAALLAAFETTAPNPIVMRS